ncbi:hypothetical protein PO124_21985 [Bacillus licheniformis]|nr:hypothetical protein [Bacillus licheniformis]
MNKEDGENHWMVEGLVSKEYRYFSNISFRKAKK